MYNDSVNAQYFMLLFLVELIDTLSAGVYGNNIDYVLIGYIIPSQQKLHNSKLITIQMKMLMMKIKYKY